MTKKEKAKKKVEKMKNPDLNILANCLRTIGSYNVIAIADELIINGTRLIICNSLVKGEKVSFRYQDARELIKGLQAEHIINLTDDKLNQLINDYTRLSNPFKQTREAKNAKH